MDALSEALRGVRITGAVFVHGEFTAPWGTSSPPSSTVAPQLAPGTEHLIFFHLVTEGRATARVEKEELALEAGDIVVIPHGHAHAISNGRGYRLYDSTRFLRESVAGEIRHERAGGGGELTRLVCGYFGCERHAERMFLAGLPSLFKVSVRGDATGAWIERSIQHSLDQAASERAGRAALLAKLSEALFMETLCRYMEELPPERTGWLAAARDAAVGRALACLHREPARAWSLDELARAAGVSRTVLVERFTHFLGQPPLAYLARWRHQLAARLLETSDRNVLQVAMDVGYESEAAFSRAFRREFGVPPARYRRRHREGQDQPRGRRRGARGTTR
jgi:AraC-like DNA-binding protein